MIKIYGKEYCKSCEDAMTYCDVKGIPYEYLSLGKGFNISDMKEICATHKSFPMIVDVDFNDNVEYIGTLSHLKTWLPI